jgi:hypothetical protein
MSDVDARLELMRRYLPLVDVEYRRLGIAGEMERYFTASGGINLTTANFERELERLRALPDAIRFDRYCELVGIHIQALRSLERLTANTDQPR